MADASRSEIIKSYPIGEGLDGFRNKHASNPLHDGNQEVDNKELRNTLVDLLCAVLILRAPRHLPSAKGSKNLLSDLITLNLVVHSDLIDTIWVEPLLDAVLNKQPDEVIWDAVYDAMTASTSPPGTLSAPRTPWPHNTSSFANSTQHREYVDVPNEMQSISISPFLRLPPEIRCLIYRILLRSQQPVRIIPPPRDGYHTPCPNNLYPSILGTCRLIYQEAHYVLYGENIFHAHRINEENHNAALIRHAIYRIGCYVPGDSEDGVDQARKLADFLGFQRELRIIYLEFGPDILEDPSIYDLVRQAIEGHRRLRGIKIFPFSSTTSSETAWRHTWYLKRAVRDQARLLDWLEQK